ncbi:MAG: hypothetical protein IT423_20675, partial [Pirellulaceae bacterium]|nr:hypothetical protein [Pirellulaceae bacterium]
TMSDNDYQNPYAPVEASTADVHLSGVDTKLIRDFRAQILALGVLWIVFGLAAMAIIPAALYGAFPGIDGDVTRIAILVAVVGSVALGWLVSGVAALCKLSWGVYLGLVFSYISLIGNLLQVSVCGVVILLVVIIQAHRVLGFAKQMKSQGIPLSTKL